MRFGLHHRSCRHPAGQNLRDTKRKPRIPRSLGFRRPRTCRYESRSNADALFDVSLPDPAVDIFSRWFDSPHDLLEGQAIGDDVSTLRPRQCTSACTSLERTDGHVPSSGLSLPAESRAAKGSARSETPVMIV